MKKHLLSLLLIVALVVVMSMFAAEAETTDIDFSSGGTVSAVCPHCKGNAVDWLPLTQAVVDTWAGDYSTANGTHYYVAADTVTLGKAITVANSEALCLHLNGKQVYRDGARAFAVNGDLRIMDHAANKGLVTCMASNSSTGGVVRLADSSCSFDLYGGTLEMRTGTTAATRCTGNGGVVWVYGGSNAVFNMHGGTIRGGVAQAGGNVYISGNAKFNMSGGQILGGQAIEDTYAITTRNMSGGNVYLAAGATFTMTGGSIGTLNADGTCINGGSAAGYGGNIYSVGAIVKIEGGTVAGGTTEKCGGNIFHSDTNGITISGGMIAGGIADDRGGNIYSSSVTSSLSVSGGTITGGQALAKGTVELTGGGGNIYVNHGTLSITGGTISDGEGKLGGNICTNIGSNASDKTAFIGEDDDPNTPALVISGGYATSNGGNIYAAEALEIGVATIKEGEADASGGNIYAKKALTVGAATISDGVANSGGNIICSGTTTLTGTTLTGGEAQYGGSLYVSGGGKATVNANISGGKAASRGGNIYMSAVSATLTITGGTVKDGICEDDGTTTCGGGNIYTNNGVFTLSGGIVSGGKATRGGNIFTNTGANDEENHTIINGTAILKNGEATYGGNLYVKSNLTLGAVTFENGTATYGSDIYVATAANLTVDAAYNGEAGIYYALNQLPNPMPGGMIAPNKNKAADAHIEINRCTGVFTGKLYLENDPSLPYIYAKEGDDKLYITGVALIDNEGKYTWFVSNADAVADYAANTAYMQVVDGALPLQGGDYVVDLAGADVQITGTGNVTIFDSANDDYKTYGTATIDGPVLQNTFKTTIDSEDTYMVESEGIYSFHRMGIKIVGVSVRPSAAGMYYTGKWQCDELLAEQVKTFGVAVSVRNQPGLDFVTDGDTLYTEFGAEDFVSGAAKTGVLIEEIVKGDSAQNTQRSKKDIYATAYITFADGSVAISGGDVAYSLYDTLEIMEDNIYDYAAKADELKAFCDTWKANGAQWNMNFEISEDAKQILAVYSGRTAYHGEAHDHAATGGNSDGNYTLGQWKMGMENLNMDFATIVDHRQVNHMYLPDWDENLFIGGSEAMSYVSDYEEGKNKMHYNMIFTDPKGLEAVVSSFAPFNYRYNSTKGIYEFSYPTLTVAQVQELVQLVQENGGMFALVHPKSTGYIDYEDALKYWFGDWTGIEVLYGYYGYAPEQWQSDANYQLWVDLLAAGKYVWVTAGSDQHSAPNTDALTTIYSEKADAETYFSHMKVGDTTCGPVGIRMCVGDSLMGSQTDFAGKRLVFSVADFHEVAYDPTHTYHVELISDTGVVYSTEFDASQPFYYGMDADDTAKFYRVEVFDDTTGYRIAIGNPIWND